MTTQQQTIAYWFGHEAAFGRHEQETQAQACPHEVQVPDAYGWRCTECGAIVEEEIRQ